MKTIPPVTRNKCAVDQMSGFDTTPDRLTKVASHIVPKARFSSDQRVQMTWAGIVGFMVVGPADTQTLKTQLPLETDSNMKFFVVCPVLFRGGKEKNKK